MKVRSDRHYEFAVGPDELWAAVTRVEDYRRWWPWLRRLRAEAFAEGETWACLVQPPLPYSLRLRVTLDEVVAPRFVTATIGGDIEGHAGLDITPAGEGSRLRLVSTLTPTNAVLRAFARVAQPVVRYGHDWVLDTGVRQFRQRAI